MTTRIQTRAFAAVVVTLALMGCTGLKGGSARDRDEDASIPADAGAHPHAGGTGGLGGTGKPGAAGMSGHAGSAPGNAGDDAGVVEVAPVPASATAFSTLGDARSGDRITLRDDGFESGARRCTANDSVCVTGGFEP